MLTNLLPGLRDLRTPLAVGYLWVVVLWLLLHERIPVNVDQAQGPIKSLYQLGVLVGNAAMLAALSFIAYLLGSMLRLQPRRTFRGIITAGLHYRPKRRNRFLTALDRSMAPFHRLLAFRTFRLYQQLETFVWTRLRETAGAMGIEQHEEILEVESGERAPRRLALSNAIAAKVYALKKEPTFGLIEQLNLGPEYLEIVIEDLPAVGIQLQDKNRDFWDTYDRQLAEAQFRYGIVPPLAVLICLIAWQSGDWRWLFLLIAPMLLFILGYRHMVEAASTLVQAVVRKMVEPPIFERLNEVIAKKRQEDEAKKSGGIA